MFLRANARACFWLAAIALLGIPAKAGDISLIEYALNFAVLCLVLFLGSRASRAMQQDSILTYAVRVLTLAGIVTLFIFPMRSPGTPLWMIALIFLFMYAAIMAALLLCKGLGIR